MSHAEAVLAEFDHLCPTPLEIHNIAFNENLRSKFLPPAPPLIERWIAEGCTYDENYYRRMVEAGELRMPTVGGPTESEKLHAAVKHKLASQGIKNLKNVSYAQIWSVARSLGFPLNRYQTEDANRWEAIQPRRETGAPAVEDPKVANGEKARVITSADIDAARRKRAVDAESSGASNEGPDLVGKVQSGVTD